MDNNTHIFPHFKNNLFIRVALPCPVFLGQAVIYIFVL